VAPRQERIENYSCRIGKRERCGVSRKSNSGKSGEE